MAHLSTRVAHVGRRALGVWKREGLRGLLTRVARRVWPGLRLPNAQVAWYEHYRPHPQTLAFFQSRPWPPGAPRFSVLMPVHNIRAEWLGQALQSVVAQTYSDWELICVNDGSTLPHVRAVLDEAAAGEPRVRVIHLPQNRGVSAATNTALREASGDYVCFMDHDDYLEPHALHQFARVILQDGPDLLYSDEAYTFANDIHNISGFSARCQFSYDYYLSHPYFVHLIGVRTEQVRRAGGLNEALAVSQDVDLVLRLLETCQTVSYVPDILYRWRTHKGSLGHVRQNEVRASTREAIERHLARIGVRAEVCNEETPFNFADVRFRASSKARTAIIIPTKNQARLLLDCIASLERTVPRDAADVVVIDHDSDEPDALRAMQELRSRHRVIPYHGPFNYSAIMNFAVASLRGAYTHYLFLNNDTAAIAPGWLEHMLGFGQRPDVGVVGATLLYDDDRVQHAGVIIGLVTYAEHAHKWRPFRAASGARDPGPNGVLVTNRDYSAVTGACMLMRADVFDLANGFDEQLAVGFNDTDLCLRVRQLGYKVIQDAHAVLYHYESKTRKETNSLLHPMDNRRFAERHGHLIHGHDPYYSPTLSRLSTECALDWSAKSPVDIRAFTTRIVLPTVNEAAPPLAAPTSHLRRSA